MKSMIVIALALASVASFSATNDTKACANLKGKELAICEAKNVKNAPVVDAKAVKTAPVAVVAKEVKDVKKDAKKDAPVVSAKNVKADTTTAPAKK